MAAVCLGLYILFFSANAKGDTIIKDEINQNKGYAGPTTTYYYYLSHFQRRNALFFLVHFFPLMMPDLLLVALMIVFFNKPYHTLQWYIKHGCLVCSLFYFLSRHTCVCICSFLLFQ